MLSVTIHHLYTFVSSSGIAYGVLHRSNMLNLDGSRRGEVEVALCSMKRLDIAL